MSWNTKTVAWLQSKGFITAVSETYNSFSRTKLDLFNIADIVAINHQSNRPITFWQITSISNVSARLAKLTKETTKENTHNDIRDKVIECLKSGIKILVLGWENQRPIGKTGCNSEHKIVELYLDENDQIQRRKLDLNLQEVVDVKLSVRKSKKA